MNQEQKNLIIKSFVGEILNNDGKINCTWDAGGDETICWVSINEEKEIEWEGLNINLELADMVIGALNLPNAGELFHRGEGQISLNELGSVIITFDSKEYIEDPENFSLLDIEHASLEEDEISPERKFFHIALEDHYQVKSYLHRIELHLWGEIDEAGRQQQNVKLEVIHGDELYLSSDTINYYKTQLKEILQDCLEKSEKQASNKNPRSLFLRGKLDPDHQAHFILDYCYYEHLQFYQKERIILIQ